MSVESDIAEMKSALAGLLADKGQSVADGLAALRATVEAMAARLNDIEVDADRAMKLHDDFPDDLTGGAGGAWNGEVRVAGTVVTSGYAASFTGTPSNQVKIYFDAVTPPAYASDAEYAGSPWGDELKIVKLQELYAAFGAYNVDRA